MQRRAFFGAFLGSLTGMKALAFSEKLIILSKESKEHQSRETEVIVKVLGTAQDGGLPQIGCYCINCRRARENPRFARLISSLAIIDLKEKSAFLVDATPDIRIQAEIVHERLGLEKSGKKNAPQGVLLTHAHIGHYTGLTFFGYEAMSTSGLSVYCSETMGNFLAKNGPWSQLVRYENISLRTLLPNKEIFLNERISLTPFQVPHRDEYSDTLGFVISGEKRKLLYIPDIQSWESWNLSIATEVQKVDIAILDGTFYGPDELPGRDLSKIGHPFITTSIQVLRKVAREGKNKIFFTHLNHSNLALDPDGKPREKVVAEGFEMASDGLEFSL